MKNLNERLRYNDFRMIFVPLIDELCLLTGTSVNGIGRTKIQLRHENGRSIYIGVSDDNSEITVKTDGSVPYAIDLKLPVADPKLLEKIAFETRMMLIAESDPRSYFQFKSDISDERARSFMMDGYIPF